MKRTKKSLLASGLALVACLALLMGATFAWFTDSVSNTGNQIQAGTLDIQLNDGTETALFSSDNNFLWEPGRSQMATATVSNAGSLWLKYTMSFDNVQITGGADITQVLDVYTVDANATSLEGAAYLGTMADLMAGGSFAAKDAVLAPQSSGEESSNTFTLVIKMQESAGNEYQGAGVSFDVTIQATQYTHEQDGFGNSDYDAGAYYADTYVADGTALLDAIANADSGDVIALSADVALNDRLVIADKDIVLNLDGHTITFDGAYVNAGAADDVTPIRVNAGGSLTITGNGTIDASNASDYVVPVSVMGENGSVVIESGTFIVDTPRESCVFAMGGSVAIYDGTFINRSSDYLYGDGEALTLNLSNGTPGTITVYGGTFEGRDPAAGDDHLGGTFVADGYHSNRVSENTYVVTAAGTTVVGDANGLMDAVNGGSADTIMIAEDITLDNPLSITRDVTIDGMGSAEITGKPISVSADVTFQNVTLAKPTNNNNNASLVYGSDGCSTLVFDGCTFSDPQWEAIQITSADFERLTVNNCTFTAANVEGAANVSYGNAADEAIRYIHIEPSASDVVADITITNNVFRNCDKVKDSVVGIYFVDGSTITVGGNTFENLEISNGTSGKLSVGWPEEEELKTVSNWTGEAASFSINNG